MRAGCDAVLVGARTVLQDDPQLTVRMVPGASPMRVVLDSTLRTPLTAKVLSDDATTVILCRPDADPARRRALAATGVTVREVAGGPEGLRIRDVLRLLRLLGVASLLVEGGGRVITSMLQAGAVDRVVVSLSPTIIGAGVEAVGPLGVSRVAEGIRLVNRSVLPGRRRRPARLRRRLTHPRPACAQHRDRNGRPKGGLWDTGAKSDPPRTRSGPPTTLLDAHCRTGRTRHGCSHLVAQVQGADGYQGADQVELDVLGWQVVEQPPALAEQHRTQLNIDHVEDTGLEALSVRCRRRAA